VYGDRPLVRIDLPGLGAVHPAVAQRRRFQAALAELDDADWRRPSRCEGWTAQDVITHLVTVNQFWTLSIQAGLAGEPSRFLANFDPVSTPAQLVTDAGEVEPAETLASFTESNEALVQVLEGLGEEDLAKLAESPPGHVPIRQVADHALWDSWIHERDVFLPLGRTPPEEPDEVRVSLRYVAVLSPGFAVMVGMSPPGPTVIDATDPHERFVVTVEDGQVLVHDGPSPEGALLVDGPAVDLVEQLSFRDCGRPVSPAVVSILEGLGQVFDQSVEA
jgi:uncharacterized protein (TIGR03083 family)